MEKKWLSHITAVAAVTALTLGTTSCASLFGNRNCRCTHPGPCVCCETGVGAIVGHRPVQRDTAADDSLLSQLLDLSKYELKTYIPEAPKRLVWQDDTIHETPSALMSGLKNVNSKYMPTSVTMDNSDNAIYFYFTENADGTLSPLHLRIQYYADDPLQFYEAVFYINGFDYHFKPALVERGKAKPKYFWENSDDVVGVSQKDLLYALSHGQWGEVVLLAGNGINHKKSFTEDQIKDFYNVLYLYLLKGGKLE